MQNDLLNAGLLAALEELPVPFAVYHSLDGMVRTIMLTRGVCEMFGFANRAEAMTVMNNDMYCNVHPDDVARISDAATEFDIRDAPYDVVCRVRRPDTGEWFVVHSTGRHVYLPDGRRLAVVWYMREGECRDGEDGFSLSEALANITRQGERSAEAWHDRLTGLPGMSRFFDVAESFHEAATAADETAAIVFIDLTGMKDFNRRNGFVEGNALLRAIARIVAEEFGSDRCARMGQDHFAAVAMVKGLPETLDRIVARCEQANEGRTLPVKIGVYADEFEQVPASVACDRAKLACELGRDSYMSVVNWFDEKMLNAISSLSYVLSQFDRALSDRWIRVYYQPIVSSEDGVTSDREALARWDDPERGLIPPDMFVPVLEGARLIHRLDLFVLERVVEDIGAEIARGESPVPVSVNLSRMDFDACDMVEEIRKRVDAAGIDRSLINIEITESMAGRGYDYMRHQIHRFHDLGFAVWMDDFGSGYSSLDILSRLNLDLIKFDMSFTRRLDESEKSRTIMGDMMGMIDDLGIATLAEGVETEEQSRFLRKHGCDKLQGYYYGKPTPHD